MLLFMICAPLDRDAFFRLQTKNDKKRKKERGMMHTSFRICMLLVATTNVKRFEERRSMAFLKAFPELGGNLLFLISPRIEILLMICLLAAIENRKKYREKCVCV